MLKVAESSVSDAQIQFVGYWIAEEAALESKGCPFVENSPMHFVSARLGCPIDHTSLKPIESSYSIQNSSFIGQGISQKASLESKSCPLTQNSSMNFMRLSVGTPVNHPVSILTEKTGGVRSFFHSFEWDSEQAQVPAKLRVLCINFLLGGVEGQPQDSDNRVGFECRRHDLMFSFVVSKIGFQLRLNSYVNQPLAQ